MNKEEINKLTQKIESCWDGNNPGDVRSFDERLKQKLTPEEYELVTVGDNMSDRYTIINKEEPRGQSVVENGIPCTARHCVTQLNGLFQDNEKLELKIIGLESKLKSIESVLKCNERKLDKEFSKKETHIGKLVVWGQWGLLAELKEEILEIIND